jgi:hypothetical protein
MDMERTPGSHRDRASELLDRARESKGLDRERLIQEWIREVRYIPKIRYGWRRWMGSLPVWAQLQGGR